MAMIENVLSGLRVIDLTQNVAGPFCTQVLGDFGAEVIKIERPGRGDDTRDWRPPSVGGQSSTFVSLNRNKRSVCIDLDKPEGVELLKQLAAGADIFIHSMKPGSAEARGFGAQDLEAVNPRLIYCAISAFGQSGPLKNLPGYDPLMQAFTGIMSVTGNDGDDPVRVGVSLIDIGTGMWAALGIFAGILQRARTGRGLAVEASLLDTGVNWMTVFVANYLATGKLPRKLGSAIAMTAPYELFHSADGHVFIAAGNDGLFRRVCEGLGDAALALDPRFLTNPLRVANREALHAAITTRTSVLPASEIVARLRRAGAPCSEMHDVSQMLGNEQIEASGMIAAMPIENAPDHKVVALPLKLDGKRGGAITPPPGLGADTAEILAGLGIEAEQVARLRESGIIG
jgi:crotonobetainyl-CoA:carnitine CoA-transferase CaiB-like acyl-CoA transferase